MLDLTVVPNKTLLQRLAGIYPFNAFPLLRAIQNVAVIAGGSLLYAEGKTSKLSDIDIFVLKKDVAIFRNLIISIRKYVMNRGYECKFVYLSSPYVEKEISIVNIIVANITIQLILSDYSDIMGVLDGFDLGCIQAAFYQDKYYQVPNRNSIHVIRPSYYRLYKAWNKGQKVPLLNYDDRTPQPQYVSISYKALLNSKINAMHLNMYLPTHEKRENPLDINSLVLDHVYFKRRTSYIEIGEFIFKDKYGETISSNTFPIQLDFDNEEGKIFYLYSFAKEKDQTLILSEDNWIINWVRRIRDGRLDQSIPLSGKGIAHIEFLKINSAVCAYIIGFQNNTQYFNLSVSKYFYFDWKIDVYEGDWINNGSTTVTNRINKIMSKLAFYENLTNGEDIYQVKRQALNCLSFYLKKDLTEEDVIYKVLRCIEADIYKYNINKYRSGVPSSINELMRYIEKL